MLLSLLSFLFSVSGTDIYASEPVSVQDSFEIFEPASLPTKDKTQISPFFSENPKRSFLAVDLDSGKILFEQNSNRIQHIASLTKLMTVLLILENHDLSEPVLVPLEATETEGTQIELYANEKLTVKTLLEAVLISSANDAAVALAFHHSGSEEKFAEAMNTRAKELGLTSAYFLNSTGLDIIRKVDDDRKFEIIGNRMSAQDLLILSQKVLEYDFVERTTQQDYFYGTSLDEKFFHEKKTTNKLLNSSFDVQGLKTGFTYLAGECFISLGKTKSGKPVLTIVLGSLDRFEETKNILSWISEVYSW